MQDRARIRVLEALPRFPSAASSQTARLFNLADLSSPLQLSRPTIGAHTAILERLILIERLPHWHSNRLSRLVKTPRLHVGDTGLAAALLGADTAALSTDRELLGQLLETFVFQELRRQASWHDARGTFFHFRDKDGAKMGVVIERGVRALAAVEVKAAATVRPAAFRGLRKTGRASECSKHCPGFLAPPPLRQPGCSTSQTFRRPFNSADRRSAPILQFLRDLF